MNNSKETAEEKRERLRQQELKNNPSGALNDSLNRANSGNVGAGMGWKETGILIILLIVGYGIYKLFF